MFCYRGVRVRVVSVCVHDALYHRQLYLDFVFIIGLCFVIVASLVVSVCVHDALYHPQHVLDNITALIEEIRGHCTANCADY